MANGNRIQLIRILASTLISLLALLCGAILLHDGVEVPPIYWTIAALAVVGVAGADVAAAIMQTKGVRS